MYLTLILFLIKRNTERSEIDILHDIIADMQRDIDSLNKTILPETGVTIWYHEGKISNNWVLSMSA